jgi:hypothetical protein
LGLQHDGQGRRPPPGRATVPVPALRRSLSALRKAAPRADGGRRTRWSCAALALALEAKRGGTVSAETMRRRLPELGRVWTRAKLVAEDDDPQRVPRPAPMRWGGEPRTPAAAVVVADALGRHRVPHAGCAWTPHGRRVAVVTPGQHANPSLAGALDRATGTLHHGLGTRKPRALFRAWRSRLAGRSPAARSARLPAVVDHETIHHATAVQPCLDAHPRVTRRL